MRSPIVRALIVTVPLAWSLVAPTALATPNFPAVVQQDLSLSYTPACALCHTDGNAGGLGTVNTPFGISVRAFGAIAYDTTTLSKALTSIASDPDCMEDVIELAAHSTPTITCGSAEGPVYGCATAPHERRGDDVWLGVLVVALGGSCMRRRRRSRA